MSVKNILKIMIKINDLIFDLNLYKFKYIYIYVV